MTEPGAAETHQLLPRDGNSRQHRQHLDVLNQQTVQQAKNQDAKNPQAELEQAQLQCQTQGTAVHQPSQAKTCEIMPFSL